MAMGVCHLTTPRWSSTRQFLLIISFLPLASVVAMPSIQQQIAKYEQVGVVSHHVTNPSPPKEVSFLPVVYLSVINSVLNVLRPDSAIIWQV